MERSSGRRGGHLNRNTLRLGLVLDATSVAAWQYELIEHLTQSQEASLALVILSDDPKDRSDRIGASKPFQWIERFERKRVSVLPDACAIRNAADLLAGIEQIRLPEDAHACRRAVPDQAAARLDVVLALGNPSHVDRLGLRPRLGIWFFAHDHGQTSYGYRPSVGFLETIKRQPFIRSALMVRRCDGSDDRIAYESYSGIDLASHRKGRNAHLWKILHFVPRTLRQVNRLGEAAFFERLLFSFPGASRSEDARGARLGSLDLWWTLLRYLSWRLLRKFQQKLYRERWILMSSSTESANDLGSFESILPPPDRSWADPHIFSRGGRTCVFFEDASIASGRGRISAMCLEKSGKFSRARPIIEKPYHLSYPFVFEWNDQIFLIPESGENRTIEVYRCKKFPYEWEYVHAICTDISAYDTTLFENDGVWWMFTNIRAHEGASSSDELHLFYADSPISRHWHAHESNPVISDVRRARPAGRLYRANGRIYRPSQDSSYRYGYGLRINEIVTLTTSAYEERLVRAVEPWNASVRAVHSYCSNDGLVMLDAWYRSPFWSSIQETHASQSLLEEQQVVASR